MSGLYVVVFTTNYLTHSNKEIGVGLANLNARHQGRGEIVSFRAKVAVPAKPQRGFPLTVSCGKAEGLGVLMQKPI